MVDEITWVLRTSSIDAVISVPRILATFPYVMAGTTVKLSSSYFWADASWRARVSWLTTLFDGKTLDSDNTYIWDNVGTGTGSRLNNYYSMSVWAGEYKIRQAKRFSPYFSWKSQLIECTFDNFHTEANVVKRVGYFSSNAVAPYASNFDGVFIEDDWANKYLKIYNNGTVKLSKSFQSMESYVKIEDYDWSKFTVIAFDFLWLWGAVLRFFVKTSTGFELIHTFNYSWTDEGMFMLSPNQPIRYEIRSTTGTGTLNAICSQVSTEWSINEEWYNGSVNTGTTWISLSSVGTSYPLLAIRKRTTHRDISAKITGLTAFITSNNDTIRRELELAPTLSAPLTYNPADGTGVEYAVWNGTITTTVHWRVLASWYISTNWVIDPNQFEKDYLAYLGVWVDNTQYPLVLCITPVTGWITTFCSINFKEFAN